MNVLKGMLGSKKVWVMVLGVAVIILNRTLGLGLTGEDLALIGAGNVATVLGIGMADLGKERAKELSGTGAQP